MNFGAIASQVNWKTTGFGIAFVICKIVGWTVPGVASSCEIVETIIVGGGFVSTADAGRLKTIIQAVDHLLWKNKIDPETLAPVEVK
jgi:hypothetical protein